jgi:hypothetical protein
VAGDLLHGEAAEVRVQDGRRQDKPTQHLRGRVVLLPTDGRRAGSPVLSPAQWRVLCPAHLDHGEHCSALLQVPDLLQRPSLVFPTKALRLALAAVVEAVFRSLAAMAWAADETNLRPTAEAAP